MSMPDVLLKVVSAMEFFVWITLLKAVNVY